MPTHSPNPNAEAHEIVSPGRVPKVPATYVLRVVTRTTSAIPVTCAASFSSAMRRLPSGVVATNSMLPRRTSLAIVPDSARTDHSAAIRPSEAAVFHAIEPPSVSIADGNGLPYTPAMAGGSALTERLELEP